jgi:ubiquinone biosynthesis accessory factor UbiJ
MNLQNQIINHLLIQNDWMRDELILFKGKNIHLSIEPFILQFNVDKSGQLSCSEIQSEPDTTIKMSPQAFIKMITSKQKKEIDISGDVDFANTFSQVLLKTRWDIEEDLSHLVGDIAAVELTKAGKAFFKSTKKGVRNFSEALVEYWQEEDPVLAIKNEVERFNSEVDLLKEKFSQLEARSDRLINGNDI